LTPALKAYADRGLFRGFNATPVARGRVEYEFLWLTRRPMRAVFDSRASTLAFPALLPSLPDDAAKDARLIVSSRSGRGVPAHKRIDARRARVAGAMRGGAFSLTVTVKGDNHAYAASRALNLINELFVELQASHPAYLIETFGFSTE
jgi:hypothetical protein